VDELQRPRLSAVAHATSLMWGPINEATLDDIVERVASLGIGRGSRVLDLGCGPAELLRRIVERTGASGVGVDTSPFALDEARARIARSSVGDRIELRLVDVEQIDRRPAHDLVLCIGPGWETGGWSTLTDWTAGFVAPGGHLLLGDGAWRCVPTAGELRTLGMELGAYPPSDAVERIVASAGVEVLWSHRVTPEDWNAYGERYRGAMLDFAHSSPDDPIAAAARERSGPGWPTYDLLHSLLDFAFVLGRPNAVASAHE
jgi:SAM-dependent methyltransferase